MAMNKAQLIDAVAAETGLTKADSERAIRATIDTISSELASGGGVTLIGFGTFAVSNRAARTGKNPQTGASIKIAARKVAKFKAGKALSDAVNSAKKSAKKKK